MHKSLFLSALALLVAASTFAQPSNTVSVFVTNLSFAQSHIGGATIDDGYGASFDHRFTERFSGEISVTSQRYRRDVAVFTGPSEPTRAVSSDRIYPIDASVSYHFLTGNRWKPYIGAGLRYVNDSYHGWEGLGRTRFYRPAVRTIDAEVSGGITWQFSRMLGIRLDAKQVFGSYRSDVADPEFKASAGLSVRF
jgi:outer membrane protein W